jgi:TonB-dependent SusC/RagA subfamily outer membrane receptor
MGIFITQLSAQKNNKKITITGTVLDVDNSPIVNAIVIIDGQKTNAITNSLGNYKIRVKPNALRIGIFTFGNGIVEEDIAGRILINFNFSTLSAQHPDPQIVPDRELVNTGYNKVKKKNLTTSISRIDGTNSKRTYATIYDMIQEMPGVVVSGNDIVIQDSKNLWGRIPPLFIVDGVPVDAIDGIPPSTVESIEVLKSTAAAIYGSRGYGGAILITTKSSNSQK